MDSYYYYEDRKAERLIDDEVIYPSNYEYSDVRNWINNDFYDTAFNFGNDYLAAIMIDEKFEDNLFLVKTTELLNLAAEKTDWAIARGSSPGDSFWCRDDSENKYKAYYSSKYGIYDSYVDTVLGIRPVLNIVLD